MRERFPPNEDGWADLKYVLVGTKVRVFNPIAMNDASAVLVIRLPMLRFMIVWMELMLCYVVDDGQYRGRWTKHLSS